MRQDQVQSREVLRRCHTGTDARISLSRLLHRRIKTMITGIGRGMDAFEKDGSISGSHHVPGTEAFEGAQGILGEIGSGAGMDSMIYCFLCLHCAACYSCSPIHWGSI